MTTMDPLWHPDGQSMFDVGAIAQGDKDDILPRIAAVMGNLVQAAVGECQEGLCKVCKCCHACKCLAVFTENG